MREYREVKGHWYMFLVSTRERTEELDAKGNRVVREYWLTRDAIKACNLVEVAGKLNRDMNDIRFVSKSVIR